MAFEFEPVKLSDEAKRAQRSERWKHIRKTILYMIAGVIVSLGYHYFTEGSLMNQSQEAISNSVFIGAFLGFFITNSPCARGRC